MSRSVGNAVEDQALDYLTQQGLRLVERNYQCRRGEIDLIMQHGEALVFVEVRFRKSASFGSSEESVNWQKQQRLMTTAQHFLQTHPKKQNLCCRFDVIACNHNRNGQLTINWISDAFRP